MKISLIERLLSTRRGRLKKLEKKVIQFLEKKSFVNISDDESQILNFLKDNGLAIIPYPFIKEYTNINFEVHYDHTLNLYFYWVDGKKLYYKDSSFKKAKRYFKGISVEQDPRSPHRYLAEDFTVSENDVVLDVGAAEGNFSLSIIEKAKHVYLFEPDKNWNKALEASFSNWRDKVTIINKFVSSKSNPKTNTICLDDIFKTIPPINFIKADVEGFEIELLKGSSEILNSNKNLKLAICTYHNQDDANQIETILSKAKFNCTYSPGYMLYYYGRSNVVKEPYLRRAVIRAVKI